MNSKYRMFKNYMYNDLGITRDDIREWTKEAVKEVALNYVENHICDWNVEVLLSQGRERVLKEVARDVFKNFMKEENYVVKLEKVVK